MFDRLPQQEIGSPQARMPTIVEHSTLNSDYSPTISRYGRSHKPKIQDDYVSTDKKVSAYLKVSPGNQIKYYSIKEPKKKPSPKKVSPEGSVKRGRPPKLKTPTKDETPDGIENAERTIKTEPQDPNIPVDGCEWMVGDLAWGRVGGHPFWPCVIAMDPVHKIFTKIVLRGRNSTVGQRWLHVQFFGDNGRRSWLNSSAVMAFNGRDAFVQLGETVLAGMRKKDPKQTSAFVIKPAVIQVWEKAVQEAEDLASATREERIEFFTIHFPLMLPKSFTREELIEKVLDSSSMTPTKKRGRKRKAETIPPEDQAKNKQIKLEKEDDEEANVETIPAETPIKEEVKAKQEPKDDCNALLSSTPRTIADRKKRQALLMQMARSNQMAAADVAANEVTIEQTTPVTEDKSTSKRPLYAESTPIEKKKPKRKYVKKVVDADFQNFCSRNFEKLSDEHPDLSEKEIQKHLQNMWNHMDDAAKSRYRARKGCAIQEQDDSESLEETTEEVEEENESSKGSNEVEVQSAASNSPAPVHKPSVVKRNSKNLFSGVKSEKVCQICERVGDTIRCRGPCQGYYHPSCVINPLPPPSPTQTPTRTFVKKGKRGKPKSSSVASLVTENIVPLPEEKDNEVSNDVAESQPEQGNKTEVDPSVDVEVVEATPKVRKISKDSSGEDDEGFRCKDCRQGRSQPCFACHEYVQKKTGESKLYRCITSNCGKVYHEECLKAWPQTSWRGTNRGVLTCPQHCCHTCVSDNPGVIKARYSNDKLVRCIKCPTSYHYGNYCLSAGSEILTSSQIICPQHYKPRKKSITHHLNAAWCFICASGGSLICCDLCPTAFHADCLKISTPPDTYVCEDCQTGRFPLYGEIVWVKLGIYRWWPAEILYPSQIPDNILNLPHVRGEFAVRFFGSHDHYWVNRGRVFLYQDGDTAGKPNYKKSAVDNMFEKAVKEASEAQRRYLEEKASRDAETRPGMKPPNYVKLKTNKPVGNVRTMDMNLSNLTPCECDPNSDNPCAPDSDCLNRILMVECHPQVCPAGDKCCNQLFEKRQYPPLQPYHTQERGWGLKTLVPLKKGDFVIEYVGEMIDEDEYKRRLADMHERNEDNFYFLTIDKDRMLDAGPKGNVARFMNHSCQPNCETQKWTVNGDTRVGLFALFDIVADTELVFNYNLESTGNDKKPCMCGAPNCSGFIGVKAIKQEKEENKDKKPVKKKKAAKVRDGKCFMCKKEGDLLRCDGKHCTKGYHLSCLNKKQAPQGYWLCPWHQCNVCNKGRVRRCSLCVNSYCQEHAEGNIIEDPDSKHLLCTQHNKDKAVDSIDTKVAKDASLIIEVDGNLSDNSTTTSSLSSDSTINNNVLKPQETPKMRTRRSKSFADDNESVKKVSSRRKRPLSVDELLITSLEKTEAKNKVSCKPKPKMCIAESVVKEIIYEVIDHLNDKPLDQSDQETYMKNDLNKLTNSLPETVEARNDVASNLDKSKLNIVKANEADLDTGNVQIRNTEEPKTIKSNNEAYMECKTDDNIEDANDSRNVMDSTETDLLQNQEGFDCTTPLQIGENNPNSECKEKENCVHNGLVVKNTEVKIPFTKIDDESSKEAEVNDSKIESSKTAIGADENMDDFELSYSENSTDKLFKSVNNSESSIEMKLTDCGTTEDDVVARKLEEMHETREMVNGIEKSSVMEVA
ncbi:histone-lysine N-methyltransferase NSD2 [Macrosteles quadrilineatus]|uniref:histone-lysine N-methyltransferase NSD2 n=1 Tax=Macrosteles quadrilineatus TaxID=74068 RepID=UPI0023E290EA|nr:histone-lysine N-methyltransferase NSD2 [Macrosteles quadrilineatus]XP_054259008.1 histone-lysine N-methyltransferase NSD2 [Macrosteles quadrilineatus]